MAYTENDVRNLSNELEVAIEETLADMPDLSADEVWADMVVAICWQVEDLDLAREFCRRQLGYIPMDLVSRLGQADWLEGI